YRHISESIVQQSGTDEKSAVVRGEVVRRWVNGREVDEARKGHVPSKHEDGRVTICMPTAANPTSGSIYISDEALVTYHREIKVEQFMKLVVACGAGTQQVFGLLEKGPAAQFKVTQREK